LSRYRVYGDADFYPVAGLHVPVRLGPAVLAARVELPLGSGRRIESGAGIEIRSRLY
jgi:hypothetical protein